MSSSTMPPPEDPTVQIFERLDRKVDEFVSDVRALRDATSTAFTALQRIPILEKQMRDALKRIESLEEASGGNSS